ncbi:hypothetical protein ACSSS7_002038 [Eimeria intestinalis]
MRTTFVPVGCALGFLCAGLPFLDGVSGTQAEDGFLSSGCLVSSKGLSAFPPLAEIEKQLPSEVLQGKEHLEASLRRAPKFQAETDAERHVLLKALALIISRGETTDFLGTRVNLDGIKALDSSVPPLPSSRGFRVLRILGVGPLSVDVLVKDDIRNVKYVLRFFAFVKDTSRSSAESLLLDALEGEVRGGKRASGGSGAARVMEERGIAAPLYAARLSGAPDITNIKGVHALSRVLMIGHFFGTFADLLRAENPLPPGAKEYVARRLLALVLLLQQAGVSHNSLNFENLLLRRDGSFVLGSFSASAAFGEQIRTDLLNVSLPFVAPELLFALEAKKTGETLIRGVNTLEAAPAEDMWSVGAMIYGLFLDGKVPYGMTDAVDSYHAFCVRMKENYDMDAHSDFMEEFIRGSGVSDRWNELLRRLLTIRSEDRITAEQVFNAYPDLLGLPTSN